MLIWSIFSFLFFLDLFGFYLISICFSSCNQFCASSDCDFLIQLCDSFTYSLFNILRFWNFIIVSMPIFFVWHKIKYFSWFTEDFLISEDFKLCIVANMSLFVPKFNPHVLFFDTCLGCNWWSGCRTSQLSFFLLPSILFLPILKYLIDLL